MLGLDGQEVHQSSYGWSPVYVQDNLGVMSIGFLLPNPDDAVIWRGPRKNGIIKQFLKDTYWGDDDLDVLIVDAPPGTSDEHISIVQLLQGCKPGELYICHDEHVHYESPNLFFNDWLCTHAMPKRPNLVVHAHACYLASAVILTQVCMLHGLTLIASYRTGSLTPSRVLPGTCSLLPCFFNSKAHISMYHFTRSCRWGTGHHHSSRRRHN